MEMSLKEFVVINANIYTMEESAPTAEAFCVKNGLFYAIGTALKVIQKCPYAEVLDARGAMVLPGLIDSHAHLMEQGYTLLRADLVDSRSVNDVIIRLQEYIKYNPLQPGEWLRGFGWDQTLWVDQEFPTRMDLDTAFPSTPIYLARIDGHVGWVNTAAISYLKEDLTKDPEGGVIVRDKLGLPTGIFKESAMLLILKNIPALSLASKHRALSKVLKECNKNGLTGIHDAGISQDIIDLYIQSIDQGNFTLRTNAMRLGNSNGEYPASVATAPRIHRYRELLTVESVKFYLDGALGSWGAAMLEPYTDKPSEDGTVKIPVKEYEASVAEWVSSGWQVATHAIGDRASRIVVDAYEKMIIKYKKNDLRLRIEHAQIMDPADIKRIGALGIVPSMQPTHCTSDMTFAESRLGTKRLEGAYAWAAFLKAGVKHLPFGSDFPTVGKINPLLGIHAAVTRQNLSNQPMGGWHGNMRVSLHKALKGYTMDAAYAAFMENDIGSIKEGKHADFILLDRDILTLDPSEIWKATILGTYLGGRQVWRHPDAVHSNVSL